MAEALEVQGVSKVFGGVGAIAEASFHVAPGEIVSLVGPSGCGKSTLLRIVAGLERSFAGQILVEGVPVEGPGIRVGVVFQEPRLMPWLTVRENIGFGVRGRVDQAEVAGLAEQVGLGPFLDSLPRQLSGGMAQRVAIARGLIARPALLLLDEPFSAVDAFTRMHLQDLLLEIAARRGITMLLVTHDVDEALYLSDRVVVMSPRPGRVETEISVGLSHPRDRRSTDLARLKSDVLTALFHDVVSPQNVSVFSPWF